MLKKTLTLLGILFLVLSVLIPLSHAEEQPHATPPHLEKGEDFTHNVLLELFVTTSCQFCPAAEEAAVGYSMEYGEHFVFVSMVCDPNDGGNEKADQRKDDYAVNSYPSAIFDGGYRDERSGNTDYEDDIEASGDREPVAHVDLSVDAEDNGDGTMDVSYSATYTDTNPLVPVFRSRLRVYIVEKVSRYPNKEGHQIPYGFIDYAFDQDLDLASQMEDSDTVTWDYSEDENATFENFVIIGAVFDKPSSNVERYVVQTATTERADIQIPDDPWYSPEYPENSDDVTFWVRVTGDVDEVELEYSICTEDSCGAARYAAMEEEGDDIYTVTVGDFGSDATELDYAIIARDPGGNEVRKANPELYKIMFGEKPGGDDDEPFHEDPQKMGWVGLGALIFVPFAVHIFDKRNEEDWDEDDDERYSYEGDEEDYELDYDEDAYDEEDYRTSWDKKMR